MFDHQHSSESHLLIIGNFLFDPCTGHLSGPHGAHYLNGRMTALLACLVENAGLVVEKDELVNRLWSTDGTDHNNLCQCISRLRQYFGDSASEGGYIATIPHHGYRLVAPVYGSAPKPRVVETAFLPRAPAGNRLVRFVHEFRERKVCRSMLIYTLVVWLVFQVADVVVPALQLPGWVEPLVVILGILGFPIAATLSWLFDWTPAGPVLESTGTSLARHPASKKRLELVLDMVMVSTALVISGLLVMSTVGSLTQPVGFAEASDAETTVPAEAPRMTQNHWDFEATPIVSPAK